MNLNTDHLQIVRKSYFNVLALFMQEDKFESRFLPCLLKWAIQLDLSTDDLRRTNLDPGSMQYAPPSDKVAKLDAIYHLVYLICLDDVVEDNELEIASVFASHLGFRPTVVSDLFKAIATRDYDDLPRDFQAEVLDFLSLNEV